MSVNITVETGRGDDPLRMAVAEFVKELLGNGRRSCHVFMPDLKFEVAAPDESWVTVLQHKFPGASVNLVKS